MTYLANSLKLAKFTECTAGLVAFYDTRLQNMRHKEKYLKNIAAEHLPRK